MTVIHLDPEIAAMKALVQSRRQQARAHATARAAKAVRDVLAGLTPADAQMASVALLEAAAEAMAQHHDLARVQALLGSLAHRYGKELGNAKNAARLVAARTFRRG
jgi:hypothetical protein